MALSALVVLATACGSTSTATTARSGTPSSSTSVTATTTATVARTTVPTATTTTTTSRPRSAVTGTVVFGPVCPVERVPPDPQCAPRPGAASIHLARADGTVVDGVAGPDGRFTIPTEPGTYVVRAVASAPSPGRGCVAEPAEVTVTPGGVAPVSVTCDTGIR